MNYPRLAARNVLDDLAIDRPSLLRHLREICCVRGAFVREDPLQASEGRLVVRGDRGIITVRPDAAYSGRTRFSIAHELGHFELHRAIDSRFDCSTLDMGPAGKKRRSERDRREGEANLFASEILMPERFLRSAIEGRRPELALLRELAYEYEVSLTAVCHRFADVTEESCAFVFARGGRMLHSWKSRAFSLGRHWISPLGVAASTRLKPVEAGAWLDPGDPVEDVALYGQTEYFRHLDLSISVLWIDPMENMSRLDCPNVATIRRAN